MEAGPSAARAARVRHRHELRTLTYVTLDQANGGIVRNLSHDGIAVQAVAAVRPRQQVRVRFDLRYPKLRVETRGEVVWSTFSGQCGIRFLDPPPRLIRQIDEWIFGDLLQGLSIPWEQAGSVCIGAGPSAATALATSVATRSVPPGARWPAGTAARVLHESEGVTEPSESEQCDPQVESDLEDGLRVSATPVKVIELRPPAEPYTPPRLMRAAAASPSPAVVSSNVPSLNTPSPIESLSVMTSTMMPSPEMPSSMLSSFPAPSLSAAARGELDWLSQPLSGRSLAWTVDLLVVIAALLLFALVFLSVTREPPKWPLAMTSGGVIAIAGLYWGFFKMFGGPSLGARLAHLAGSGEEELEEARGARFR